MNIPQECEGFIKMKKVAMLLLVVFLLSVAIPPLGAVTTNTPDTMNRQQTLENTVTINPQLTSLEVKTLTPQQDFKVTPAPPNPEYLVISPNDAWVKPFATWKTRKGVPTVYANTTWIYANVAGTDNAEKIWNHINNVYTANPTLTWVLLIGDSNTLPPRYVYLPDTAEGWGFSGTYKPTDFYYSVMDDTNWDDDSDSNWGECPTHNNGGPTTYDEIGDWDPDLYVGRLPYNDQTNITTILSRVLQYEVNPTGFSATGWDTFLLAGSISNYDEEGTGEWFDGYYTDEAELSDEIADNLIPGYYTTYHFYENRSLFWNYSCTNTFTVLNDSATSQGVNLYNPALINLAAHGSPLGIARKYDADGYPYGFRYWMGQVPAVQTNITGVAIGDINLDGINDIAVATGPGDGNVVVYNGATWGIMVVIAVSAAYPSDWPTCITYGNIMNNGTPCFAFGDAIGLVHWIFIYAPTATWYWYNFAAAASKILCIDAGEADNLLEETTPTPGASIDIAWGELAGPVWVATIFGTVGGIPVGWGPWWAYPGPPVYSLRIGDPDDNAANDMVIGTGFAGAVGYDGDCWILTCIGGPWSQLPVTPAPLSDRILALDIGDAENDGSNEIVLGLENGSLLTYEGNVFPDMTVQTILSGGPSINTLRIGNVDSNSPAPNAIIAGDGAGEIRKFHTNNTIALLDWCHIDNATAGTVTGLDVGALWGGGVDEIAAGTKLGDFFLYDWDQWHPTWGNLYNVTEAAAMTSTIPPFVYADACLAGAFDYAGGSSLAEATLRSGAIGFIGSMRISWYYLGPMSVSHAWGLNRLMDYLYWQMFFAGTTNYQPGATLYESKWQYNTTYGSLFSRGTWENSHRKNLLSYGLFGDPEVDIYTDDPDTFTFYCNPNQYPGATMSVSVVDSLSNPVANARVCVMTGSGSGSYYQVDYTNSTGSVDFVPTGSHGDTLNITVTKHNFAAYQNDTITLDNSFSANTPYISYNGGSTQTLFTSVFCSGPSGIITPALATRCTWTLFQGTTNLTHGDLTYSTGVWSASGISVANRPEGTYFIRCYIRAFGSSDTNDSTTFVITHALSVTTPSISYVPYLLNQTGYIPTCSYSAHGVLDNTEATTYSYAIYDDGTGISVSTGNLVWSGSDWRLLNLAVDNLPEGTYYVRGTFADSDTGPTTSAASSTFTIMHTLTVSAPTIVFDSAALTVGVQSVTATCSYTLHGTLDNTEAISHTYRVYNDATDTATSITGSLTWSGGTWIAAAVDVSSLAAGTYYVVCRFADACSGPTAGARSATFTIAETTPPPPPPIPGFPPLAMLIGFCVTIIAVLTVRRRRRKL